jgi:hypothetical protein
MKTTGLPITPDTLMTLEAYHKFRKASKADVIAHRKLRSVHLGEHINVQFERRNRFLHATCAHGHELEGDHDD